MGIAVLNIMLRARKYLPSLKPHLHCNKQNAASFSYKGVFNSPRLEREDALGGVAIR